MLLPSVFRAVKVPATAMQSLTNHKACLNTAQCGWLVMKMYFIKRRVAGQLCKQVWVTQYVPVAGVLLDKGRNHKGVNHMTDDFVADR